MSIEVKIPPVGESITSGVVSVWHKKSGEYVDAGEALLTFETDKVSTEITAEKAGVLETKVDEGQEVKIGEVVAVIDDQATAPAKAKAAPPNEPKPAAQIGGATFAQRRHPFARGQTHDLEEKIDPAKISGTGKGGRVTKGDVISHLQTNAAPATDDQEKPRARKESRREQPAAEREERFTRKKMSPLRRKIAAQFVMSQQTTAILTTFNECDMSEVMALRKKAQEKFTGRSRPQARFHVVLHQSDRRRRSRQCPSINSRIEGDDFILNHYYDIGVAVGTERGLVVPVVRDADKKSFADLERDVADYATRARDGKIKIEDLQGGTFTISNGGVYGSLMGTPILNPPQSGILGMHAIQERPVAVKGEVVVRPMMYLALSYDHRAVDGKEAVTFLVKVKEAIENPTALLLDL